MDSVRIGSIALGVAACLILGPVPWAAESERADATRGSLLYDTACGACHTTQAHWRDKRLVHSWPELLSQVESWQRVAGQGWSRSKIEDVAAYLNQRFYHLPCPVAGCAGPDG
jgi:hypothetical protein